MSAWAYWDWVSLVASGASLVWLARSLARLRALLLVRDRGGPLGVPPESSAYPDWFIRSGIEAPPLIHDLPGDDRVLKREPKEGPMSREEMRRRFLRAIENWEKRDPEHELLPWEESIVDAMLDSLDRTHR